jgi:hypothetical protein
MYVCDIIVICSSMQYVYLYTVYKLYIVYKLCIQYTVYSIRIVYCIQIMHTVYSIPIVYCIQIMHTVYSTQYTVYELYIVCKLCELYIV